jgi:hypothetical protein
LPTLFLLIRLDFGPEPDDDFLAADFFLVAMLILPINKRMTRL